MLIHTYITLKRVKGYKKKIKSLPKIESLFILHFGDGGDDDDERMIKRKRKRKRKNT